MHVSNRRPLQVATAGAVLVGLAAAAVVSGASAQAPRARGATGQTLRLVEKGGGIKIVDNPPKAQHPFDFSAGDIVVVSRGLFNTSGHHAGSLRLVCVATGATTQQCTGTETLPGGTLELAGVSSAAARTTVAVIGGTGLYAGARGTSISADRSGNADIADQTITLLS